MKYLFIVLVIFLIGCKSEVRTKNISEFKVKMKYCKRECLKDTFKIFHTENSAFLGGSSSSSMGGIQQKGIWKTIKQSCDNFLKEEKCCKNDVWNYDSVKHAFGFYGICSDKEILINRRDR